MRSLSDHLQIRLLQRKARRLGMVVRHKADDAKPFSCFKCGKGCEDWEGSECETCTEFFCDDHLVTDAQAIAPECCHACDRENRAILDTYGTMPKGRD